MKPNIKPLTPRCGLCKRLYSSRDDDGSGLCLHCRPAQSQPLLLMKGKPKQIIVTEVGTVMDDFDTEEMKNDNLEAVPIPQTELENKIASDNEPVSTQNVEIEKVELKIEDIIEPGRYGVSNSQMIPAMKMAITENSVEKLTLLKATYFYTFNKSIRYLKKSEREYITTNLK